jgi:hypothetical protein
MYAQVQAHSTQVGTLREGTSDARTLYPSDQCARQPHNKVARRPQGTTTAGTLGPHLQQQWRTDATSGAQKTGRPTTGDSTG